MQRNDTRPILRGAKRISFLLGLLLLPTIIVIATPRQTYAEGLLNRVGCLVGSLLDASCASPKSSQANSTNTAPASPTTNGGSSQAPANSSTASATNQPLVVEPALNAPLASVQPLASPNTLTSTSPNANLAYAVPTTSNLLQQPQSGTGTAMPIEATGQGWRILGILWYWWVIGALGVAMLFATLKSLVLRSFLSLSNR